MSRQLQNSTTLSLHVAPESTVDIEVKQFDDLTDGTLDFVAVDIEVTDTDGDGWIGGRDELKLFFRDGNPDQLATAADRFAAAAEELAEAAERVRREWGL